MRAALTPGTTAVLLGASGTGKSTLVNALLGESARRPTTSAPATGAAATRRSRRELLRAARRRVPDRHAGIRVAGLWDGTGDSFADVDALAANCRFADCGHDSEPGCAVRAELDPERIAAWRKLQRELAWVNDRRAASREREQRTRRSRATCGAANGDFPAAPSLLVAVEAAAAAATKLRAGVISARGRVYRPRGSRQRFSQATPSPSRSLPLSRR